MPVLSAIADATDSSLVTVRGRVVRAYPELLTAPLSGQACVYWEHLRPLREEAPEERGGRDFWLEDETGRVLVRMERADVDARAVRRKKELALIESDLSEVESRIRELKRFRKEAGGEEASEASRQLHGLAKLATLLCAMRAQANGKIHVGGDRAGQAKYIEERAPAFASSLGEDAASIRLVTERNELVLQEGDELEVTGLFTIAALPNDLPNPGGYREMPTCAHLRASHDQPLVVTGLGEAAPLPSRALQQDRRTPMQRLFAQRRVKRIVWTSLGFAAATWVAWAFGWIG